MEGKWEKTFSYKMFLMLVLQEISECVSQGGWWQSVGYPEGEKNDNTKNYHKHKHMVSYKLVNKPKISS